ncbi:MAG TPA: histidine phosphatase family protein [Pseudonocardiaceae bacterium]|nr:histidine phosphatase family protein [Pseudonocardiaceae bacterium]
MCTVILLRHGRSTANTAGVLAGRTPGVVLDEHGRAQAQALVERLAHLPLAAVVSSPLQRCRETVVPLAQARELGVTLDDRFIEMDYGEWTGRQLRKLVKEPLWKVIQAHPSAAVFPGGEGLAAMQARAVAAVREWDAKLAAEHGPQALWLVCTHGDIIKAVLADALGVHLDGFQRIVANPCSVSAVTYTETRPFVQRVNDCGDDLGSLIPPKRRRQRRPSSDATPGGATGTG